MHRILLRRIEVLRISDGRGNLQPVVRSDMDHLRQRILGSIVVRSLHIRDLEGCRGEAVVDPTAAGPAGGQRPAGGPRQPGPDRFVKPHLGGSGEIGHRGHEVFPVRRERHAGNIVFRVGQRGHHALGVHLVQGCLGGGVAVGDEIHISGLLVHADDGRPPVLAVRQPAELFPVIGQEVDLLPARLEGAHHIQALRAETHLLRPVQPGVVVFVVDMLLGAVGGAHTIEVEVVLKAGFASHEKALAVGTPERDAEILVLLVVEVGPDGRAGCNLDNAYAHRRIGLPRLGVAGAVQASVLPEGGIDREHRHSGIVEAVEPYHLRVG